MSDEGIKAGHYWYNPPDDDPTIIKVIRLEGREAWTSIKGHGCKVHDLPGTVYPFRVEDVFDGTALFGLMEGVKNLKEWFNKHENRTSGPGPTAPPPFVEDDPSKMKVADCNKKVLISDPYVSEITLRLLGVHSQAEQVCVGCGTKFIGNELVYEPIVDKGGHKRSYYPIHKKCWHYE